MDIAPPKDWARIQYEYEETERPIHAICAAHGISDGTLRTRMRRWNWRRRRPPIPSEGPPRIAVPRLTYRPAESSAAAQPAPPPPSEAAPPDPPPYGTGPEFIRAETEASAGDGAMDVARVRGMMARILPAIEAVVAKLAAEPLQPHEMEQTGRTLGTLTRALRGLDDLLTRQGDAAARETPQPAPAATPDDDDQPEDIDELRDELVRRIEALVADRCEEAKARDLAGW